MMKTLRYAFARTLPIMAGYLVLGLGVSLICLVIFGSSNFLIPSMLGITAALTLLRGPMEKRAQKEEAARVD
ncbi:hypothetical protein [Gemmiger sp.]|uniref:hypothetical protein n=1 Tax=Gemmiger sp. TaxID=2049027 RepID=UPI00351FC41D